MPICKDALYGKTVTMVALGTLSHLRQFLSQTSSWVKAGQREILATKFVFEKTFLVLLGAMLTQDYKGQGCY
jgi:hypothetical protein